VQAAVDQPDVRHPAIGDDLGDQLLAAFGPFASESESGLLADRRQHRQEPFGDPADVGLAAAGFRWCDHRTDS
jgi:hypothetical protein